MPTNMLSSTQISVFKEGPFHDLNEEMDPETRSLREFVVAEIVIESRDFGFVSNSHEGLSATIRRRVLMLDRGSTSVRLGDKVVSDAQLIAVSRWVALTTEHHESKHSLGLDEHSPVCEANFLSRP